jgi:hypothetical protein
MGNWKTFTPEELKALRTNPYVKSATPKMVRFTASFKEEFWRQYSEEYKPSKAIMRDLGFDVEVLGEKRIGGILIHIRDQARSGQGFRDIRKVPEERLILDEKQLPPSKALLKIQHRLDYLEQEIEFIKKNILADNAARRKK